MYQIISRTQKQINMKFTHPKWSTEDRLQIRRHFQSEIKYRCPDLQFIILDKIGENLFLKTTKEFTTSMKTLEKTNLKLSTQDFQNIQTENGFHSKYRKKRKLQFNFWPLTRSIISIRVKKKQVYREDLTILSRT